VRGYFFRRNWGLVEGFGREAGSGIEIAQQPVERRLVAVGVEPGDHRIQPSVRLVSS